MFKALTAPCDSSDVLSALSTLHIKTYDARTVSRRSFAVDPLEENHAFSIAASGVLSPAVRMFRMFGS